jgi:hypothetical protein
MSKAIQAINVMIGNSSQISNIIKNNKLYFFLYANKHKWSIRENQGDIYLFYYPGQESLQEIATMAPNSLLNYDNFVTYSTEEFKTREAIESLQELYRVVKEKSLGVDKALDDIIGRDESF